MKQAIVLFATAVVAGCLSAPPREPDRYYVLEPAESEAAPHSTSTVRVAPMSASSFYDTQDIVYSREPGMRAYYQFNRWTERPQRVIQAQLASRLEESGPESGLALNTNLDEIYHDAVQRPGSACIALTAQLADPASGAVLARRTFRRSAPAASYDARGAVQGFRQALGALLDDVAGWVEAETTRKAR